MFPILVCSPILRLLDSTALIKVVSLASCMSEHHCFVAKQLKNEWAHHHATSKHKVRIEKWIKNFLYTFNTHHELSTVPTCSGAKGDYLRKKIRAISLWDKQSNLRARRALRGCKHGKCTKNKLTFHRAQNPNWVHKISTFPLELYV